MNSPTSRANAPRLTQFLPAFLAGTALWAMPVFSDPFFIARAQQAAVQVEAVKSYDAKPYVARPAAGALMQIAETNLEDRLQNGGFENGGAGWRFRPAWD